MSFYFSRSVRCSILFTNEFSWNTPSPLDTFIVAVIPDLRDLNCPKRSKAITGRQCLLSLLQKISSDGDKQIYCKEKSSDVKLRVIYLSESRTTRICDERQQ